MRRYSFGGLVTATALLVAIASPMGIRVAVADLIPGEDAAAAAAAAATLFEGSFAGTPLLSIIPASPTFLNNCIPFGNNTDFGFTGFIYRDVPAFNMNVGDKIRFDLGALNSVDIRRNIYFSAANKNPEGPNCARSQGVAAVSWSQVVSDGQIPVNSMGNNIVGDFELTYLAESAFSFVGGALLVGFQGSPPAAFADFGCEQVLNQTSCNDASGQFYGRFCLQPDLYLGVLDGVSSCGGSGESRIGGMVLEQSIPCAEIDAIDDSFSVINDGTTADFFVLANDECSDDTPISVVALPGDLLPDRGGLATTDGATVSYTPAGGFIGFEEFTYTAQDAGLVGGEDPPAVDQDTAVTVVDVLEDIIPDAVEDLATALQNQPTDIDVLANDSLGNAPNGVEIVTQPANGSATVQANDTIRYSPNFGFFGDDSFEYRLTDANGDSDVATVTVCVLFGSGQFPIDIMPSDPGNNLNLRAGQGASISIAILSASGVCGAPNLIDPSTLKFGPGQAGISGSPHVRDVDGDGDDDLLVKFLTNETGIACGDTQASVSGSTFDSQSISGSDAINTFNCPRTRKRW
jgi:hypothetical protein